MYEDNEKNINWMSIIKKVVIVIVTIALILGLVSLVKKCSKNNDVKPNKPEVVDFSKQFDQLEKATLKYLTKDNLPTSVNSSKTIRLKNMISKGLVKEIKDDNGNKCDTSSSYAEVTRLNDNYAVKLSLTCDKNSDYRIIYVGCFANCKGGICKGNENSKDGICEVTTNNNQNTNTNTNTNTNDKKPSTNANINTNVSNKKPSTNTNKKPTSNTNNNTNSNTNNNNNDNNSNDVQYVKYYEYEKCTTPEPTCPHGTYENGVCERLNIYTKYGKVITTKGLTKTSYKTPSVTNISVAEPADLIRDSKTAYLPASNYISNGIYNYKQYKCSTGTIEYVDGNYKCKVTTTTKGSNTCEDPSYHYNSSNNTCTKVAYEVEYFNPIEEEPTCKTKWSKKTSLLGWTRTGNTKTIKK